MTGKGDGQGESAAKLEKSIGCIKYTLFCFNVVAWVSNNAVFSVRLKMAEQITLM